MTSVQRRQVVEAAAVVNSAKPKPTRPAAEYVRMSTDRQDLSPAIQRDAIASFAETHGLTVVRSYADEGKSGVRLTNRPGLRELLKDVGDGPSFAAILVYDVSRWGRFQDVDAAAYYEYHCRLNGVQVIYVAEPFTSDITPINVLIKNMKRVMAAEYSRDLATKSRAGQQHVVSMGYHMGPLPPFGYRRRSVSSDGTRRTILQHGQLKLTLTDRIEWVLAPQIEVALVQRIFQTYGNSSLKMQEIASLVRAEGWRTMKGSQVSNQCIRGILENEAFIGNFVWGLTSSTHRLVPCLPTRFDGSVPRIIDDLLWKAVQARIDAEGIRRLRISSDEARRAASTVTAVRIAAAVPESQDSLVSEQRNGLRASGSGMSADQFQTARVVAILHAQQIQEFGVALAKALNARGIAAGFESNRHLLSLWGCVIKVRLLWPDGNLTWYARPERAKRTVESVLFVRMNAPSQPLDFFLIGFDSVSKFPARLPKGVPRRLTRYWALGEEQLIAKLTALGHAGPQALYRCPVPLVST